MPEVRHPRARDDVRGHPPSAVTLAGDNYAVEDGTVTLPGESLVRALADAYDLDADDLRESGTDGGCPYCDEYDGDHVAQHIAQAHPDAE